MLIISYLLIIVVCEYVYACVITDMSLTNITSAKILNVESNTVQINHSVGGSVKIIDGCTFSVRNMTIIPTGNAAYWYGVPKTNNTDLYPRVVAAALGSYNGQFITFHLDPQYSFTDMDFMEIRSEGDNRAYGAFAITGNFDRYYNLKKDTPILDPTQPFSGSITTYVTPFNQNLFISFLCLILFVYK